MLSISGWWPISLNNAFVFPDPDPLMINTVYGWSGTCDEFGYLLLYFLL